MTLELIIGDCREVMTEHGPFDMIVADPPYEGTKLKWDRHVAGWEAIARRLLKPSGSLWVFGSLRFFMKMGPKFDAAKLINAQEIVWEKHNGSGMHRDRFKRVHELAAQFYRADTLWKDVWNCVQMEKGAARARSVHRRGRPPHLGGIEAQPYVSAAGGDLIKRSVIYERSCHGHAIHPTQKPTALLEVLIKTSCPPGGLVGDFFAGSGAAGEAAHLCGRNYVGPEKDPKMAQKARDRLAALLPMGFDGK